MAYFVVFNAVYGTSTSRNVLRWGECPSASVSAQVRSGDEGVATVAALGGLASAQRPLGWTINPATGALMYFAAPYTPTPAEAAAIQEGKRLRLLTALRSSDWAMLPDAPLSTAQRAEWTTWRANVRAIAATPEYTNPSSDFGLPARPTTQEF